MTVPLIQQYRVARYLISQKLRGVTRYPLVLMLEPLFRCNLACAGCGKIDYPEETLNRRMTLKECLDAVDECGAPIVSIPGGEPLIHREIVPIVEGIIARKKFVYLCTNALLLKKRIDEFTPSPYLTFSVHLDGDREHHDASVCEKGVFDRAVAAIKIALEKGFRVTVNCTLFQNETAEEVAKFMDYCMELGVEGVTISPGYSYQHAPQQEVFLHRNSSKQLFRDLLRLGKSRAHDRSSVSANGHKKAHKKWRFNQSSLFMDFLAGNQTYQCTPWGNPTRNIFGWQKPCYLMSDEGYAASFKELMEDTEWDRYGNGKHPKCADCMVHCGYEPTAVIDTFAHPLKALKVALLGSRTEGPMAPELPVLYTPEAAPTLRGIPIMVQTEGRQGS